MEFKDDILQFLSKATGLEKKLINLEKPEREDFGDYSTNVALQSFQLQKTTKSGVKVHKNATNISGSSPRKMAEHIVDLAAKDKNLKKNIEKSEVAGPGFVNFFLKKDAFLDTLVYITSHKDTYGYSQIKKDKKVVVEYTDPNPFKEFHIGHLISNVTGESICRLQEAVGATVWRADYFGDVGVHAAKSVWGIREKMSEEGVSLENLSAKSLKERLKFMGQGYAKGTIAFDEDEKAKEEIQRLNTIIYMVAQRMWEKKGKKSEINYDPDGKINHEEIDGVYDLYVAGRDWSLEYFETIYKRLGTKFDGYYPESVVGESGYKLVKENIGKVFKESEGAVIFEGEKFGLHTRVFINKHNLPTYEAKELGLAPTKYADFPYDESIIVVGKEIKEYFSVLVEALKQVNYKLGSVTTPICTGMVNLPEGKMSSRKGNVVTVNMLLDQLKIEIQKRMEDQGIDVKGKDEISEKVAVGALKYAFLKNSVGSDFIFDMKTALALEGNSGPYLQYTFARCQSVLEKANYKMSGKKFESEREFNKEETAVLKFMLHFREIVIEATDKNAPNLVCTYLYELAQKFNTFYNAHKIIGSENENFRLSLTEATGTVLKNGLYLLGIQAPERM